MRIFCLLLALMLTAPLFAQDPKKEEKPKVDLAVAFPATTMVFVRADTNDYFETLNPKELFAGVEGGFSLPDLGELARDRLELNLTDDEAAELAAGIRRVAAGLLDVALSGPKFAIVIEHKDLKPLARALKEAQAEGASTVPDVQDYYGNLVYEVELPLAPSEPRDDFSPDVNPLSAWANNNTLFVSIFNNFLLIATGDNAVKDGIDFLTYPEDATDTLLGNARYKEAVKDFDKPQGLLFVNVQSVITTIERLAGDKGSSAGMFEMFKYWLGGSEEIRFYVNLIQYEQFKSFAAGFWLDEQSLTVRMDANLVFHNPPGWFEAVRVEPKPMPLTTFIPDDAMFAVTDCVDDVNGMYARAKEFFFSRARAAGHSRLLDAWQGFEDQQAGRGVTLEGSLKHLGGGQALVIMPREKLIDFTDMMPEIACILGVRDRKAAEEYFYGELLNSPQREAFQTMEGDLTPVTVVNGVEIHQDSGGGYAFAFMDGDGKAGAFVVGKLGAVRRVVQARTEGSNLNSMAAWRDARQLLYDTGSTHMYVNFGALLRSMGSLNRSAFMWGFDPGENVNTFDRDDTEKDDDPIPFLSEFFGKTVIVGSARSAESSVSFRVAAAGWPNRGRMRELALHYRDTERNRNIRDDFVRLRDGANAHFAIKGKPATEISQLVDSGVLGKEEWGQDPYGADDDSPNRKYKLAEVPKDIDARQAILCAYQEKPGLRGNHLVVLWNSHVVELTPQGLQKAIELAKKGEPLPPDGIWYRELLKPLYTERDPRASIEREEPGPRSTNVEVEVIDDEGTETTIQVDENQLQPATETYLDTQPKKSD